MSESRTAIIASDGTFSYDDLDDASRRVAGCLLGDNDDLKQTRVAFLVAPSFAYTAVQRGRVGVGRARHRRCLAGVGRRRGGWGSVGGRQPRVPRGADSLQQALRGGGRGAGAAGRARGGGAAPGADVVGMGAVAGAGA